MDFKCYFKPQVTKLNLYHSTFDSLLISLKIVTVDSNNRQAVSCIKFFLLKSKKPNTSYRQGITYYDYKYKNNPHLFNSCFVLTLAACGGGGSSGGEQAVVSIELIDPTPGVDNRFGEVVVQLANGNIVVTDPGDSSIASKNGAVHLYSQFSSTPIASIFGDNTDDELGGTSNNGGDYESITELSNGNYVIVSEFEDEGGVDNVGSARLMNGTTGVQIGDTLFGATSNDFVTSSISQIITVLPNGHFVLALPSKTVGGLISAGSVQLINGNTAEPIDIALVGDSTFDLIGYSEIKVLANGHYVVSSSEETISGISRAGSVRLMNGITAEQIGATIAGDIADDQIRSDGITILSNNNFIIISSQDDHQGGLVDAGSVILVDEMGVQIGNIFEGADGELLGGTGAIAVLSNGNFAIGNFRTSNGLANNAGSVRLINGSSNELIAPNLLGDNENDFLSVGGLFALNNNNYVIVSRLDDENGAMDVGSIRLMNGNTGVQISNVVGDVANDLLGNGGSTSLPNNNFVVLSDDDDESGVVDAGSIRLINGSTGEHVSLLVGASAENALEFSNLLALPNSNYVLANANVDIGGLDNIGTAQLFNGSTGQQIGNTLIGTVANDRIGNGLVALPNNNYVVLSNGETHEGIANVGSARIMNGSTA